MSQQEPSDEAQSEDRNRGLGLLLIIGVVVIGNMLVGEIGDRLGIPREGQTSSEKLLGHFWFVGSISALMIFLALLARLLRGSRFVRQAFPGFESWEYLSSVALLATIYAVLGASWLIVVGDKFLIVPLTLSVLSSLILVRMMHGRRGRG